MLGYGEAVVPGSDDSALVVCQRYEVFASMPRFESAHR